MTVNNAEGQIITGEPTLAPRTDFSVRVQSEKTPTDDDFAAGFLPPESYVDPWTVVSARLTDIGEQQGRLVDGTLETTAQAAAGYLGVQ